MTAVRGGRSPRTERGREAGSGRRHQSQFFCVRRSPRTERGREAGSGPRLRSQGGDRRGAGLGSRREPSPGA